MVKGKLLKLWCIPAVIGILLSLAVISPPDARASLQNAAIDRMAGATALFVANEGQFDPAVLFYARLFSGTAFVTREGDLVYSLPNGEGRNSPLTGIALKESLVGGRVADVKGEVEAATKLNVFRGKDPRQWKTGIATYQSLSLGEVYKGVDVRFRAYGSNVEKLFTVHPAGAVDAIRLKIDGGRGLRVNGDGELEIATELGTVKYTRPVAYQEINGRRVDVAVAYRLEDGGVDRVGTENVYGFTVGKYDRTASLVIDPLLAATYLGGSGTDLGIKMALDGSGNIVVAGITSSADFPTTIGALDRSYNGGSRDIFVAKFNSAGDTLLFSTIIGGSGDELGADEDMELYKFGMALDLSGNIYISAGTSSANFPVTAGAYQATMKGSSDAFVAKLNPAGNALVYSTFLGGSSDEQGGGIAVDGAGNAYVAGKTKSADFPTTTGAYDRSYNNWGDIFVTKLNPAGNSLIYSTYLGGNSWDEATDIAIDASDNAYVLGGGESSDYPTTPGAFDRTYNGPGYDIYLTKLNAAGSQLVYSTFLGGSGNEWAESLAVDSAGNAYVAGEAHASGFPVTPGAFDTTYDGNDRGFVTKVNSAGTALLYSTFISNAWVMGLKVDNLGNAYVTGGAQTNDFPTTPDAVSGTLNGTWDVIVAKLNPTGTALLYSTYLGGSAAGGQFSEFGLGIDVDMLGTIYLLGITSATDFPLVNPVQASYGGDAYDTFVAKIAPGTQPASYSQADLAGTWEANSVASGPGAPWWVRMAITVSANGAISGTAQDSTGGNHSISATASISSDGIVTMSGGDPGHCRLDTGKTVMVCTSTWAGSDFAGTTEMTVYTKGASYSLADLAGVWEGNSLETPGPWWMRATSTITSDGSFSTTRTASDGPKSPVSGTFSITSDGIITSPLFSALRCSMEAGKTIVVCTAPNNNGTELIMMTKKAASYSATDLAGTWDFNYLSSGASNVWARSAFTISQDGSYAMSQNVSDGTTRTASGNLSISASGVIGFDSYPGVQCAMDAGKTVIACTSTDNHGGVSGELIVMTKIGSNLSPVNGICGTASGTTVAIKPASNLCGDNSLPTVSGIGPWNWTCSGSNGGSSASCSANLAPAPVNGTCGTAHGTTVSTKPNSNLCGDSSLPTVSGTGPWSWNCSGSNGGSNVNCSASVAGATPAKGDVNGDTNTDVFDALLTLQYALNLIPHTAENEANYHATSDVYPLDPVTGKPNGDGKIDVMDALLILQRAVNLIDWSGNHPVPSPPAGVSATGGNGQGTVTWNPVSGATSYNLYYSTTTGVTKTTGTKISGVTSPNLVTGLSNGVVYYFVVTAVNVGGESALSSPETTVTPVAGPPPITYPLNGNCGNSTLQGTWYESTGTAHSHIPLQLQFVSAGTMGGTVYGYTGKGALAYSFEEDPTMCGSIMFTDGAQTLVSSYPYTVSTCELTLTYWGSTYHYCRGGVGNCTSCN